MYYYVKKYNGLPVIRLEDWINTENISGTETDSESENTCKCNCSCKGVKILDSDTVFPLTNVSTYGDKIIVEVDLAGFEKENIKVSYLNNIILVSADFTDTIDKKYLTENTLRQKTSRKISLSNDYNINALKWNFKNGLVTIVIDNSENIDNSIDITDEDTEALYS